MTRNDDKLDAKYFTLCFGFKIWFRRRNCLVSRLPGTNDVDAVEEWQHSIEKVVANWMWSFDALRKSYHFRNIEIDPYHVNINGRCA